MKTPLKSGYIIHRNINWFRIMKIGGFEDLKKQIESFRAKTSGPPRKYIDNTLEILEFVKSTID